MKWIWQSQAWPGFGYDRVVVETASADAMAAIGEVRGMRRGLSLEECNAQISGASGPTATRDLAALERAGILQRSAAGGRSTVYRIVTECSLQIRSVTPNLQGRNPGSIGGVSVFGKALFLFDCP